MRTIAALVTPRGAGAIASIKLSGPESHKIIKDIFEPAPAIPGIGKLAVGSIADGPRHIDQVVLACETADSFTINCHGSALIIEMIMELLASAGTDIVEPKALLCAELVALPSMNTIALEARLEEVSSRTIAGSKLVANQAVEGLTTLAMRWSSLLSDDTLPAIRVEATRSLEGWDTGRIIIHGAQVVLIGPPNSGKSTLLNALTGRQTSIVADEPGTTRDHVWTRFAADPLSLQVFDTAGIGASQGDIDALAQARSLELLRTADLAVIVLDSTRPAGQFEVSLIGDTPYITICNKSDIARLDVPGAIHISAALGRNIDALVSAIRTSLGVDDFDLSRPVPFTSRQHNILSELVHSSDCAAARRLITELLNGPLAV